MAAEQTGTPVTTEEEEELKALRASMAPGQSLKRLEDFAAWLFAGSGALAALTAAGKITDAGQLSRRGRDYFTWAVILFAIALALAVLARAPQLTRYNPFSAESMETEMRRVMVRRFVLLVLAGVLFAVALVLVGVAPLAGPPREEGQTALMYAVDDTGGLTAELRVRDAKKYSMARLAARTTKPTIATQPLPRIATKTNGDGEATLKLPFKKTGQYRSVEVVGTWLTPDGGTRTTKVRFVLRSRVSKARR